MNGPKGEFTLLLDASREGDPRAWSNVVQLVYGDLLRLARRHRSQHTGAATLDTTGLVHESYLRLAGNARESISNRAHFFSLASRVMRQIICDYARERLAHKRGGGAPKMSLEDSDIGEQQEAESLVSLDEALMRLEAEKPRWAKVVELRFFAGLSEEETAETLDIPLRRVQRDWHDAREWLANHMN